MIKIYYFNPGHEYAVLNKEPSYTLPANLTKMKKDLSSLPLWYAKIEDVVLVEDSDDISNYESLIERGFTLPSIVLKEELKQYNRGTVSMWGIDPMSIRFFKQMNKIYHLDLKLPLWNDDFIYLTSRLASHDFLSHLKQSDSYLDFLYLPTLYTQLVDIEERAAKSQDMLLAKAPFSSSGRGLLWLPPGELKRSERQILQGIINKQKSVSIETVYHKVRDFAMEFISNGKGEVSFVGYSVFETNEKGGYVANVLKPQEKLEQELQSYVSPEIIHTVKYMVISQLSVAYGGVYEGCIGVDMMIVRIKEEFKIHPCVEINMRYNMGYLSMQLMNNYVDAQSSGFFYLDFDKKDMLSKHLEMKEKYPLKMKKGKVESGYLSLCPINKNTKYRAYILVNNI